MTAAAWFDVDKQGLAKLMAGRHKAFVLYELLQNAWDQNVTEVKVSLSEVPGRAESEIVVEDDDPDGFADLAHAYTLFAESRKKANPEKRGRFNIGEKLVLALARRASMDHGGRCGSGRFDRCPTAVPTRVLTHGSASRSRAGEPAVLYLAIAISGIPREQYVHCLLPRRHLSPGQQQRRHHAIHHVSCGRNSPRRIPRYGDSRRFVTDR
jgi:hypothetical protein